MLGEGGGVFGEGGGEFLVEQGGLADEVDIAEALPGGEGEVDLGGVALIIVAGHGTAHGKDPRETTPTINRVKKHNRQTSPQSPILQASQPAIQAAMG